jgi:hypothetical protein
VGHLPLEIRIRVLIRGVARAHAACSYSLIKPATTGVLAAFGPGITEDPDRLCGGDEGRAQARW